MFTINSSEESMSFDSRVALIWDLQRNCIAAVRSFSKEAGGLKSIFLALAGGDRGKLM